MVVNAGEIGVSETGQYERLAFEGTGYLGNLLWGQALLAHLFHGDQLTGGSGILGLIHRAKATFAYHTDDAIALLEHVVVGKLPGGRFDGMFHLRSCLIPGSFTDSFFLVGSLLASISLIAAKIRIGSLKVNLQSRNRAGSISIPGALSTIALHAFAQVLTKSSTSETIDIL